MLTIKNIQWIGDSRSGCLRLLDQTRLPGETAYLDCRSVANVWDAIKRLVVRGAPAIGIAAAYGCVLGVQGSVPVLRSPRSKSGTDPLAAPRPPKGSAPASEDSSGDRPSALSRAAAYLATSRPTAVNLFWALDRMKRVTPGTPDALLAEARAIHAEDAAMCRQIGVLGLPLLGDASGVLTHCNAGALATGGIGTATAPLYLAHEQGRRLAVFADETRPLLQGARLTAFELQAAGIDVTLICDDMAAQVMREGKVQAVITGADRIAANGDAANKIGTYNLAVLAKYHGVRFYVAAPSTTFDLSIPDGGHIPIEQRGSEEITEGFGRRTAPLGVKTYSPAFDVTPHDLITALITERGVVQPVNAETVARVLRGA
jgi:methylthioribose-1-phosphate isomerase